jgi:dienelactone hydrolase
MVTTREIEYRADGTVMAGRLAVPGGTGQRPAVLIAHEGPGLDERQRQRAGQLAGLGYVAFALDYHGAGRWYSDHDEMLARLMELAAAPDRIRAIGGAGLDVLLAEPRVDASKVAAIGYCFGGAVVLELARGGAELQAVVGFHPSLTTTRPEDARNITGKVLVCVGADDPFVPVEQRLAFEAEMRAGGVNWQMNVYGGAEHSFTHPDADPARTGRPGIRYHQPAAERSWRAMLDLFAETLT